ncbi:MAG: hypothetical protein EGR08_03615 [Prevotella sp.]|nr:hypothetical protein [Prevotella sp.]
MLCLQTYIFFFNNDTFSIFIFHLVHIKREFVREWRARKRIEREEKERKRRRNEEVIDRRNEVGERGGHG